MLHCTCIVFTLIMSTGASDVSVICVSNIFSVLNPKMVPVDLCDYVKSTSYLHKSLRFKVLLLERKKTLMRHNFF